MEWQEFTQYIIDEVMLTPALDSQSVKEMQLQPGSKQYEFKRFHASKFIDRGVHSGHVEVCVDCPNLGYYQIIEKGSKQVKLFD